MYRDGAAVILVLITFFVISFITNVLGPIFPALIEHFQIGLGVAGFFPFAFFIAYGLMSIPAGLLVESWGEKKVMLLAFAASAMGAALFAAVPQFYMALLSLFLIGAGMAFLQVAINPLLRVAGGEQHFAFYSVLAQLCFGAAATLSPLFYSYLSTDGAAITRGLHAATSWLAMYWVFALLSVAMVLYIAVLKERKVERNEDEKVGSLATHRELLSNAIVRRYFVAIVCYVATEQGIANSISVFLQRYHDVEPTVIGAAVVSDFWLAMTIGCAVGLALLKLADSRHVLIGFSLLAIVSLIVALTSDVATAMMAFRSSGFALSVMFSVIFSLALNSLDRAHGSFAGILCTGIIGGAIASPIIGAIADWSGSLRMGMLFLFVTLSYILSIGFWAKPLISNSTIWSEKTHYES